MSRPGTSKSKLKQLNAQRRARTAEPAAATVIKPTRPPRPESGITSYTLPTKLLDNLQKIKFALQSETGQRGKYSASAIVRAALQHFVQLEMEEQIELITKHNNKSIDC